MQRGRIEEIVYMRSFAMLAVVMIHTSAMTYHIIDPSFGSYPIYEFLNRFFRYGTATFIFITGLVMFYGYIDRPLHKGFFSKYFRNRFMYIFTPYVVWVVLYEIHTWLSIRQFDINADYFIELFQLFFQGNTFYHFYFFFVLIQLYLLFPLLLYWAQKSLWFVRLLPLIGLVVQSAVYVTDYFYSWLPFATSYFFSYLFFFNLGGFVGLYYGQIKRLFKIRMAWLFATAMMLIGLLYVYMHHLVRWDLNEFATVYLDFMYMTFSSLSAMTILVVMHFVAKRRFNWFRQLGVYSFGIFLVHPMVINYLDYWLVWEGSYLFHIGMVLRFMLTIAISFTIVYLIKRYIPYSAYIVGR
ncbi:peptidoglycan/LPS O-acetylase OafA/YrhL [Alkalibacillus flavidus]|uniref:Peptidoglycan/LPS O-acetylase OafA/YrhL n=2 Tax=Alkalibacillus flavidus TaxID=546021 RepID=A0ABV2KU15_9BACI